MVALVTLCVVLLFAALMAFFAANSWLIRRDMTLRFRRLQAQLEQEAFAMFRNVPEDTSPRT